MRAIRVIPWLFGLGLLVLLGTLALEAAEQCAKGGGSGYHLIVITQANDTNINSVADLKGKRVAHVSQTSNSGHQAPVYFFSKVGVVPERDYQIAFTGTHDNSILGVVTGDYDAAAVADTVLQRMVNRGLVKKTDYKVHLARVPPGRLRLRSQPGPEARRED